MKQFKLLQKYFTAQLQETVTYRGMIFIWMFETFAFPFTNLLVWFAIAKSSASVTSQLQPLINYYSLIPLTSVLIGSWHGIFMAQEIRTGKFSLRLLRPVFPLVDSISNNLAEKSLKIFFILPFIFVSHWLFTLKLNLNPTLLLQFLLALVLSAILSFLLETIIGLLAFWMDDVSSLLNLNDIADYTLGGRVAPIFLFPALLQQIAFILPFRYLVSFPLELLLGTLSNSQILQGFTIQLFWISTFTLISLVLWRSGIRLYSALGG